MHGLHGRITTGSDWCFQKFCGSELDWIQNFWIRIGLGLKNFTVGSSVLDSAMRSNHKQCPWIRCQSRLRQDSAFFSDQESKFCEKPKPDPGHFSISAVVGVCMVISSVKTLENFDWIDDNWILKRSRTLKFEKFSYPHPDFKILKQEGSQSLKKWLRPSLQAAQYRRMWETPVKQKQTCRLNVVV